MRAGIKQGLAYLPALIARAINLFVISLILAYFWLKVKGISFAKYLIIAEILTFPRPRVARELAKLVRTGEIEYYLVKPRHIYFSFLPYYFGLYLVELSVSLAINLPLLFFFKVPMAWLLLAPFSFLLLYSIYYLIFLSSFWLKEVRPLKWLIDKLLFLLGGVIVPVSLFPSWLRAFAEALPFRYAVSLPAALAVGFTGLEKLAPFLLWCVALPLICLKLEELAVKHYEVAGG